ncbi:sulfite exporter TauE/SafE family protein [Pseudoalteromonas xiamenensis]|uniref:cytochrome c biogenesis CcdA family protein n=1 Tax=Pseudoalteromonas xiamenensis TaxID=882626 RepID=UPI0027E4E643|nr:cytochrome c biogenesis protein CcdA [Pseudoalteromonas xiamenensis]WMN60873.1 sulfite exporter TauE/SafE family protein [Pseudoalteromonas xiamenensis]
MEFTAIPLALLAGILSLVSPCVLPMIPAVAASAMQSSKWGLVTLALGISLAFAFAGTVLTFLLLNLGISTQWLRYFSTALLLLMGMTLLIPKLANILAYSLSRLTSRAANVQIEGNSPAMQFLIGASLGLVWLPCVGPTLGTAIALASTGQSMPMAFAVMLAFGFGTAIPLVAIGHFSGKKIATLRTTGRYGKYILGATLVFLAIIILTGVDKVLETWALEILPDWVSSI